MVPTIAAVTEQMQPKSSSHDKGLSGPAKNEAPMPHQSNKSRLRAASVIVCLKFYLKNRTLGKHGLMRMVIPRSRFPSLNTHVSHLWSSSL